MEKRKELIKSKLYIQQTWCGHLATIKAMGVKDNPGLPVTCTGFL